MDDTARPITIMAEQLVYVLSIIELRYNMIRTQNAQEDRPLLLG